MTQEEFFKRYTYSPSRDRIGGGGFGTVYKAYDNVLHREVAIKVSEVKTTADGKKTFSLKDEFEALNHVPKHPNIANYEEFYSFEMPNGIFDYAVMQYYPDGNLSSAIKESLTAKQKEDIAIQLLEGIDFLHKHKVVHRDLKPGNILIVKHGGRIIPLITDFGLSKAAGVVDGSVFSNSFGAGTPKYSSPEQLQGQPLRFNTDLWSYGAILYEVFTGEQLFTAGSGAANTAQADMEIYNKIVNGNVQSLAKMPEKWRKVAERCLVVDATNRAKDATELFGLIRNDEDETEGPTKGTVTPPKDTSSPKSPHSGPDPLSPMPIGKPKHKKGLWIGIAAAAVVALLVFLLWPRNEPAPTDPDTQAYEDCQTADDYRAYMRDYGRNALHYAEAQQFVKDFMADSTAKALVQLTQQQAQQHTELETQTEGKNKEGATCKITFVPNARRVEGVMEPQEVVKGTNTPLSSNMFTREGYIFVGWNTQSNGKGKDYSNKAVVNLREDLNLYAKWKEDTEQENNRIDILLEGTADGHEWVDLGLPSGTLWAICNVGAGKPEGYGNYYAWGETSTKSTYNWNTYKYANGSYDKLTKYCSRSDYGSNGFTDKQTTLQSGDDPATANWGSGWQTPSEAQWEELLSNTTNQWTTQNGVKGRLFTSKKNGQTLFLPAAGLCSDKELEFAGSVGSYWSRSLHTGYPNNVRVYGFTSDNCGKGNSERIQGYNVRPVRQK